MQSDRCTVLNLLNKVLPITNHVLLAENPNAYINQRLAEFCQQLMGALPEVVAMNHSIFSLEIEQ